MGKPNPKVPSRKVVRLGYHGRGGRYLKLSIPKRISDRLGWKKGETLFMRIEEENGEKILVIRRISDE